MHMLQINFPQQLSARLIHTTKHYYLWKAVIPYFTVYLTTNRLLFMATAQLFGHSHTIQTLQKELWGFLEKKKLLAKHIISHQMSGLPGMVYTKLSVVLSTKHRRLFIFLRI